MDGGFVVVCWRHKREGSGLCRAICGCLLVFLPHDFNGTFFVLFFFSAMVFVNSSKFHAFFRTLPVTFYSQCGYTFSLYAPISSSMRFYSSLVCCSRSSLFFSSFFGFVLRMYWFPNPHLPDLQSETKNSCKVWVYPHQWFLILAVCIYLEMKGPSSGWRHFEE